ncbi:MAG: xanthine dehydrogenase family protein subunit M [Deltaproteobacteria bacterium]|nr:xanthine dehydrogenase family protein subunit M [Deltaproteobacteria bacterium]
MKPAPFKYFRPESLDEALALLAKHGDEAKVLAGGQSLIPAMNFRLAQPAILIDINRLSALSFIEEKRGQMHIGALTRHSMVERHPLVAQKAPLLAETMPNIAHVQIRNRGTFGGSIAHADPAAELPAAMTVRGARICLRSTRGERWVDAPQFFVGLLTTAMEPDELLTEVAFDELPKKTGWCFVEVARRHGDYALLGVAATVRLGMMGKVKDARICFVSAGETPALATNAQDALNGQAPSAELAKAAAQIAAAQDIDPPSDIHASARFRRHLATKLTERALNTAFARARGETR